MTVTVERPASGDKSDAMRPPIGCTDIRTPAVSAKLDAAVRRFIRKHPGRKPTREDACLGAGAQIISAEVLGAGFKDAGVFEHHCGWGSFVTCRMGIDFTRPGVHFADLDLRCEICLRLSSSAALAQFRGRDMLAGNPDVIGLACMIQRRAELVGCSFTAALHDALTITARILQAHRSAIEQAAAFIERDGRITRGTAGVAKLLARASAVPIAELPQAPEQARKLARLIGACRMDLGALAREVSQLAMEGRS